MTNPKTTTVAVIAAILLFALVGALILKKIDAAAFAEATGTVGSFGAVVIGWFAADGKKPANPPTDGTVS
jgi:membrane protein involved in colicin uptake